MASSSSSSLIAASAVVLTIILNASVLCHGGRTSTYMRTSNNNVDMPVDDPTYYVPPGQNTPQQASFFLSSLIFIFYSPSYINLPSHERQLTTH